MPPTYMSGLDAGTLVCVKWVRKCWKATNDFMAN